MDLVMINVNYPDYQLEQSILTERGIGFRTCVCKTDSEVAESIADADIVVVGLQPLNAGVIQALRRCRVIGRLGVGLDTIDVDAATQRGIAVINLPDYCAEEVASHAVSLLLALSRKLFMADDLVRSGRWSDWEVLRPIRAYSDTTLGIVGLGNIGAKVAQFLRPLVKEILAYDANRTDSPLNYVRLVTFDELLSRSDWLTIHAPLSSVTRGLFSARTFDVMRRGSILVNVSRGGIIVDDDLSVALKDGRLSGAGLDVMETEPLPLSSSLLSAPNLIVTNHVAWYSESSIVRQRTLMMRRILDYLDGIPVPSLVNPEVKSQNS
ncbi:MAG: hypothetical protein C7B45_09835 [Sulfobacillus acidophilus]|uniref:C-terminal binding protein n=1 Tax=Sulfobacillus acidophilus TaxID=53633 RepID=A0A2T2WHJ3_9FIRM|nr:MAG: hypothetical protein C7B45_09835 [Sulfobacillus acidophilus]